MYWCAVMCYVLWCAGACSCLQCTSPHSSALKFTIRSMRNETGHWIAQMQLGHEAGQKDAGPWEVDVDHTTAKCEDSESVLIAATVTAPSSDQKGLQDLKTKPLGPGYEMVPGLGYYKFHTDVKNWREAKKTCEEEGAHLMIINSEPEAAAMKLFWDKNPKIPGARYDDYAYVGFHDLYKEGEMVTIFNETLASTGYVKWKSPHPAGEGYDCGLFGRNLMLIDNPCDRNDAFFCEREL